ncbi:MAG: winged helix-turn-helix transcriptional regulator [Marmoricola sp.]
MSVQLEGRLATRGDQPLGDHCPMERALKVIGNRTSLLLIREAFYGATRFDQLWKRVGITEASASQRLRALVDAGVLEKRPYQEPGQRSRSEYLLTAAGRDLIPVVLGLLQWGVEHTSQAHGTAQIVHQGCGAEVRAVARCAAGHDVPDTDLVIASAAT